MKVSWILPIVGILVLSCERTPKSLNGDNYLKWVAGHKEFNRKKTIKNVTLQSRFLPGEYLAYKEYLSSDAVNYDSILNGYRCGLSFQITIQAEKADRTHGNLNYYKVTNQQEFSARVQYLNFNISDFIFLSHRGEKYLPVLSHYEGYDQLGNKLVFQMVFLVPGFGCDVTSEQPRDNILVTFDDPFWDLGTVNFEYDKNVFDNIPKLKL